MAKSGAFYLSEKMPRAQMPTVAPEGSAPKLNCAARKVGEVVRLATSGGHWTRRAPSSKLSPPPLLAHVEVLVRDDGLRAIESEVPRIWEAQRELEGAIFVLWQQLPTTQHCFFQGDL